ncbi:ABC transporter substrate-binding protein [bacterium]|nr:MAG: ABC transporter substrate-binding protein [bacterium]
MDLEKHLLSRGTLVKGAAAATVAAGFPAIVRERGEAAETLKLGMVAELTGVYAGLASHQLAGAKMAVAAWNARGGVLGRRIELVVEDDQNNPGVAVQKARKLVNEDKVVALSGSVNSSVVLAVSNAAAENKMVYISCGSADAITGANCHWTTFRVGHSTWMLTHASGYSFAQKFGKKWYAITPDYAYGHALVDGYKDVLAKIGGQLVGDDLVPLGTADFSPYLTKVAAAKPDVVLALVQGADYVNMLKQAGSFGLIAKFPICTPQLSLEYVWTLPEEARVGYGSTEWYYHSDLVFPQSDSAAVDFVKATRKSSGKPPTNYNTFGYIMLDRLIWSIQKAGGTDAVKMARSLEGAKFTGFFPGEAYFRAVDHQLMWPVWVAKVRAKPPTSDPYDVFDVIDRQPAEKIEQSAEEKTKVCHLGFP